MIIKLKTTPLFHWTVPDLSFSSERQDVDRDWERTRANNKRVETQCNPPGDMVWQHERRSGGGDAELLKGKRRRRGEEEAEAREGDRKM